MAKSSWSAGLERTGNCLHRLHQAVARAPLLSPPSLLCCFLHLPDPSTPQVVSKTTHVAALVLQENELLVP